MQILAALWFILFSTSALALTNEEKHLGCRPTFGFVTCAPQWEGELRLDGVYRSTGGRFQKPALPEHLAFLEGVGRTIYTSFVDSLEFARDPLPVARVVADPKFKVASMKLTHAGYLLEMPWCYGQKEACL